MLKKFVADEPQEWKWIFYPLLFTTKEVTQGSLGFSLSELLYSHLHSDILYIVKDSWEEQQH